MKTYEAYAYSIKYSWAEDGGRVLAAARKRIDENYAVRTTAVRMGHYDPKGDYRVQFNIHFGEGKVAVVSWYVNSENEGLCNLYYDPKTEPDKIVDKDFRTDKFLEKALEEAGIPTRKEDDALTAKEQEFFAKGALEEIRKFVVHVYSCDTTPVEVREFSKKSGDRPQFDIFFRSGMTAKVSWRVKDGEGGAVIFHRTEKGEETSTVVRKSKDLETALDRIKVPKKKIVRTATRKNKPDGGTEPPQDGVTEPPTTAPDF